MNLYNKYRPQDFSTVFGQKAVVQILKNSIEHDKIAHAYIFTGPRGTGKTTIARILSKAINCTGEDKPCLQCTNCQAFAQGSFLDIVEIDGASNRKIEDVRELIDKAKYLPQQGQKKIYIIDEVHALTKDAFNALLKIIEEPPLHVVFILATTDVHKVLPTILSRCQRFDFKLISLEDLAGKLGYILEQEKIEFEQEALLKIAQLAQGGARNAEVILQQLLAGLQGKLTLQLVEDFFGLGNDGKIDLFLENLKEGEQEEALEIVKTTFLNGESLDSFYNFVLEKLRDNLLKKEEILFSQEQILTIIKILAQNHKQVFSTHFPSLYLEISVVEIINFLQGKVIPESVVNVKTVSKVVAPPRESKAKSPTEPIVNAAPASASTSFPTKSAITRPENSAKPTPAKANPQLEKLIKDNLNIDLGEFRTKWLEVIQSLPFRLKTSVKTGKPLDISSEKELVFNYAQGLKETISKPENIEVINKKLQEVFALGLSFVPSFGEVEKDDITVEDKSKTVLDNLASTQPQSKAEVQLKEQSEKEEKDKD